MAPLLLEEKPEKTKKKIVSGIIICIECGSPNTTILTNSIYCRDCRSFKLFRKRKPSEFLSQNGKLGVSKVK